MGKTPRSGTLCNQYAGTSAVCGLQPAGSVCLRRPAACNAESMMLIPLKCKDCYGVRYIAVCEAGNERCPAGKCVFFPAGRFSFIQSNKLENSQSILGGPCPLWRAKHAAGYEIQRQAAFRGLSGQKPGYLKDICFFSSGLIIIPGLLTISPCRQAQSTPWHRQSCPTAFRSWYHRVSA